MISPPTCLKTIFKVIFKNDYKGLKIVQIVGAQHTITTVLLTFLIMVVQTPARIGTPKNQKKNILSPS